MTAQWGRDEFSNPDPVSGHDYVAEPARHGAPGFLTSQSSTSAVLELPRDGRHSLAGATAHGRNAHEPMIPAADSRGAASWRTPGSPPSPSRSSSRNWSEGARRTRRSTWASSAAADAAPGSPTCSRSTAATTSSRWPTTSLIASRPRETSSGSRHRAASRDCPPIAGCWSRSSTRSPSRARRSSIRSRRPTRSPPASTSTSPSRRPSTCPAA